MEPRLKGKRRSVNRTILTLCGSARFTKAFKEANRQLTLDGVIVLTVGHHPTEDDKPITAEQKQDLDQVHMDKIAMSDAILVLNVDGYIGYSTFNEIRYAMAAAKDIYFLDKESPINLSSDVTYRNAKGIIKELMQ